MVMKTSPPLLTKLHSLILCMALLMPMFALPHAARAQADPIFDSSVFLLRSSLLPDRRGQFSVLLRSLRQLQDPTLSPLMRELLLSENRIMRIHGILGLAETATPRQVDLKLLADVKDPAMQSELLGAALDSDILNVENAKLVLAWPGTDMDAKVVIATHLLEKKAFSDVALLKQAAETTNLARKGIIAMLLLQLGDPAGGPMFDAIDQSTESNRDDVRNLILQTAFRFKFEKIAPWAFKIGSDPKVDERVRLLALRTALRFGQRQAMATWTQQYQSTTDAADQMRLALSLLNLSVYLSPEDFDLLVASTDPLIKQMGIAGKAVAAKKGVSAELGKLIAMNYPVANAWTIGYANFNATPEDAKQIFTDLIHAYAKGGDLGKAQRLDEAMAATQYLCEKDTDTAKKVLLPLLNDSASDKSLIQGLMVGLIRATKGEPHKIAADITRQYTDINSNALRNMLLAKYDVPLNPTQLNDLGLLVRGGGSLPDTLRIQAAWVYLKQTKQTDAALKKAVTP